MIRRNLRSLFLSASVFMIGSGLVVSGGLLGQPTPGFVYETDAEFQTLADVDGDGFRDLVVADKTNGQFRIAEGQSDGSLVWRSYPGDSGLGQLSGFSAGPLITKKRDNLLFSDSFANRIQLIDTPEDGILVEPIHVPAFAIGPALVTAINVPAGGSDYTPDYFDVIYHSIHHLPENPNVLQILRNDSGAMPFSELEGVMGAGRSSRPNRVFLMTDDPVASYAVVESDGAESSFKVYDPASDPLELHDTISGLPLGVRYLYADFDGDKQSQFLFFTPGEPDIFEVSWHKTNGEFTALTGHDYGEPITDIRVIGSGGRPELLIIHNDGQQADRVAYKGKGMFSVVEQFTAQSGGSIRGALSADNKLHILEGPASDGSSTTLHTYGFDGTEHVHETSSGLPLTPFKPVERGSNVLVFDAPPLTTPNAKLLSRHDAGAWTSAFSLQDGTAEVSSEQFDATSDGLGNPQVVQVKTPAEAKGGLTNQVFSDLSIFFQGGAVGTVAGDLTIRPKSGSFNAAVRPEIEVSGEGIIGYRTENTDWQTYSEANPPVFSRDTVLLATAVTESGDYTNLERVEYTFPLDPAEQDSNGDGVPDFVAEAYGLDPLSDTIDADADGFTDLEEILAGTDPTDPDSAPEDRSAVAFEQPNAFNLLAAPAIPDPSGGIDPLRPFRFGPGPEIVAHLPDGYFLGSGATGPLDGQTHAVAFLPALEVPHPDLFSVVASEVHFEVEQSGLKDYGRQVAALLPTPTVEPEPFEYTDFGASGGYDNLSVEAEAWRSAALAHYANMEHPTVVLDPVDHVSSLHLLLVERILGQLLHGRGLTDRPNISLTPFRESENPLEAGAEPGVGEGPEFARDREVDRADLLALQRRVSAEDTGFEIPTIVTTTAAALNVADTPEVQQLLELSRRLYTTHATHTQHGTLRQPFDALRQFVRTGSLDQTGYAAAGLSSTFPSNLLDDASAAVTQIDALIQRRQVTTVAIYFDGSAIDPACPVWEEVYFTEGTFDPEDPQYTGSTYALVDERGDPFPVARAFPLTAGSVFKVTGYLEDETPCGDYALEVIPEPALAYINNASPGDQDGDLIPDGIQKLNPGVEFAAFGDSDGDGYSDLQEILSGSDAMHKGSIPMQDENTPETPEDLGAPTINIEQHTNGSATIRFDYPSSYARHLEFELYESENLEFFETTNRKARRMNGGQHELDIPVDGDAAFFRFRMRLK